MTGVTRSELEELLSRWFQAENLSPSEVDRLHRAWQEREKDRLYLNMLRRQFDPANLVAGGTAWWEERQQGQHDTVIPITPTDLVKMWLSFDPLARPPRARPWCPDLLVGRWRLVGVSANGRDLAPTAPREWTLQPDGRLETVGDPDHDGWTWSAERGISLHLRLLAPLNKLPRIWSTDRVEGGEMDLYPPEMDPGFQRWRRLP